MSEAASAGGAAPAFAAETVAYSLLLDTVAVDVVRSLRGDGVPSILLKGPAIATWLYGEGAVRGYVDVDLLVPPARMKDAEDALARLGFELRATSHHAHAWVRPPREETVDLHWALVGVGAQPEAAWDVLAEEVEEYQLGTKVVRVLSEPARALHVALHAAQHPWREQQSLEDLARALERVPRKIWHLSATLARRLEAEPAFAAGLRRLPVGRELAHALELSDAVSVEVALRASESPPLTLALERLSSIRSVRGKISFAFSRIFPEPARLRHNSPLARRGVIGLVLTYVGRLLWLAGWTAPAFRAWLRARRRSRRSRR
jgi:hypothetical protein